MLPPSDIQQVSVEDRPHLQYHLYVPRSGGPGAPVLVTVHGISGNAREHAKRFRDLAEEHGVVLVAPRFSSARFRDYQRLGRRDDTIRADIALKEILRDVARRTGAHTERIYLFGYSGGGQFAHRFALAHPKEVIAYVVGAAGWYTFPDETIPYPRGMRGIELFSGHAPVAMDFLQIRGAVVVGDRDTHQGSALNKSPRISEQQGHSRFERGRNWVKAMNQAARQAGLDTQFEFRVVSNCGHSFRRSMKRCGMGSLVFELLFDATLNQKVGATFLDGPHLFRKAPWQTSDRDSSHPKES